MNSQLELTQEQEIVRQYLEKEGCKIGQTDPNGCLMFEPIGASGNGGTVFKNGNVYIFNEHTAPFENKTTCFFSILTLMFGPRGAKSYIERKKPQEIRRKSVPTPKPAVTLDDEEKPIPKMVGWLSNASVPRRSSECVVKAIANGDLVYKDVDFVWDWIRRGGDGIFKRESEKLRNGSFEDPEDYARMKAYFKQTCTPCLTQMLENNPTIGWLDVDGKENDAFYIASIRKKLADDNRVIAVFQSLSGNGIAIGIGIQAETKDQYEAAMTRAIKDFERDYSGLKIDRTCARYTQLRALSGDENLITRQSVRYYRSFDMIPEELKAAMQETSERIDDMAKKGAAQFKCESTLLGELDSAIEALDISIVEDAWTGKRTYKLKGQVKKDINSLYLAIKDYEQTQNGNVYRLGKVDIIDHLIANCVDERDSVLNTVFSKGWDRIDRWGELKSALHLDNFSLKAFQMWMRQGAGLLYNKGEADDVQRNFMLILYSRKQSIGKSDLARRLSCGTNSFTQKGLDMTNKDVMSDLYSHWIHEFGELGTTFRKKDLNTLKNYITNTSITLRRPYDRDASIFPVRTSIIGTTNDDKFFTDDTGNRRYIVIDCMWDRKDWPAIDALDIESLWLQARYEYLAERNSHSGLYPYTMDANFQEENDLRCKDRIVKPREMYILSVLFTSYREGQDGLIRDAGDKVCISMTRLMYHIEKNKLYNISEAMLAKSLRHYGFDCVSTHTDDVYYMKRETFKQYIRKDISYHQEEDKDFSYDPAAMTIV